MKWLFSILFPVWRSPKIERFRGVKSEDFLQKYYDSLDKDENDAGHR